MNNIPEDVHNDVRTHLRAGNVESCRVESVLHLGRVVDLQDVVASVLHATKNRSLLVGVEQRVVIRSVTTGGY